MKKECEELFIELVSPYITAREVAKQYGREDWHGVFAFAEALEELLGTLDASKIAGSEELTLTLEGDLAWLRSSAKALSDVALNQESRSIHGADISPKLSTDAMNLVGEIQGKLRQVIIDNVCACESGPKVTVYHVGKFPKQDKTLLTLRDLAGGYKIKQVHDDGDLTVDAGDMRYVVTTDGEFCPIQKSLKSD